MPLEPQGTAISGASKAPKSPIRVLGTFDDADVVPVCGGNDEKSWGWSLADVVSTGHVNNRNRSNSVLATRDYSFCCRASSPNTMVGIGQGRSTVSAV